jgi:GNAT superfamily N-acetyltransferase
VGGAGRVLLDPHDADIRRDTVVAYLRKAVGAVAGEVRDVEGGWLARTDDLPLVWTLNQLHVTSVMDARGVLALAERHQADMAYRHVVVDDDATGAQVADCADASWTVERELLMVLDASAEPVTGTAVTELTEEEMVALMRSWLLEEHAGMTEAGLGQLEEYNRREGRRWNERRLGERDRFGVPCAMTKLRMDGTIAWVEDVYTVPAERRRGFARALVSHAAWLGQASGHELTFLSADDDDWPKHLYAEIGFRAVARRWIFHRGDEASS